MRKRTTIYLDTEVLERAKDALGTKRTTETIGLALSNAAATASRKRLLDHEFPGLTLDSLAEMREGRRFVGGTVNDAHGASADEGSS